MGHLRRLLWLCALFGLCVLAGCSTSYQSSGFGGGYSESMLAPDRVRIVFRGNGYTSPAKTNDFALLRAAEFTLEHGYRYFAILDSAEMVRHVESELTPAMSRTTGTTQLRGNIYGNRFQGQGEYSERTTYTPATTITHSKPSSALVVQCFAEDPDDGSAFDAAAVAQSIRAKYNMDPPTVATVPEGFVIDETDSGNK